MLVAIANRINLTQLCPPRNGMHPRDTDRIIFNQGIRTIAIGGKTYACYPDGSMVEATSSSSSSAENSGGKSINGIKINDRLNEGTTNIV